MKNIQTLELGDVEGIFAYFCFVLRNKLLTYNLNFSKYYYAKYMFNEEAIAAALSLNDHGVCRHKVPMLSDLYHDFGIDSKNIICNHYEAQDDFCINANDYLTEEDYNIIKSKESLEEQTKELERIINKITIDLLEKGELENIIYQEGKHCINLVNDGKYSYLLDPSWEDFYMDKNEEEKYFSNRGNYFKVIASKKYKPFRKTMSTSLELTYPLKSSLEITSELNKREKIISENVDEIMHMYKDIKPTLEEAERTYKLIIEAQ